MAAPALGGVPALLPIRYCYNQRECSSLITSPARHHRQFTILPGFAGQKHKGSFFQIIFKHGKIQAPLTLCRIHNHNSDVKTFHTVKEVAEASEHILDGISCWISKRVAQVLGPYFPKELDLLDWLPASIHHRIHSSERAATIFVRECLHLAAFYFFFTRADTFCRWVNRVYLSKRRHGNEITDVDYEASAFCAMRDPLRAGVMVLAITHLIHVSAPLLRQNIHFYTVDKMHSIGLIIIVTWFLFRWKKMVVDNLIMQHKPDAARIIAFDKILSLAMYYLAGTCIGEVAGFALRSVLAIGGISGIAVGLAAKEVVGNFLGGTILFISRPFVIGDKIKAGSFSGQVEDIDFLHTKLVGFDKTPLHVPNQTILNQVIINYSRAKSKLLNALFPLQTQNIFLVDQITERITKYLFQHPKVDSINQHPVCFLKEVGSDGLLIELSCVIREKGVPFYKAQQDILVHVAKIIIEEGGSFVEEKTESSRAARHITHAKTNEAASLI